MAARDTALTDDVIAAREAQVFADAPRIAPLPREEAGEAAIAYAAKLRGATAAATDAKSLADVPDIILTMVRHPALDEHFSGLSIALLRGKLPPRDRELAILRIAWLWQAPFPFGEHVTIGKLVGLTPEEIDRVTIGSAADGWTEHERAVLRATEELFEDGLIGDASWAVLARSYDEQQLMELPIAVGQFTTVSFALNSMRVRMRPGNGGLRGR